MEFKTLKDITTEELLAVFNLSFSDYVVPFHLTKEQLVLKISSEKLDLDISVGAFDAGKLAGFILQAEKNENGQKIIYNGGTGVVPGSRGKGLVRKMYDFSIPQLKERNAEVLLLEVIEGNLPAIRAYENLGFAVSRRLLCFRGTINTAKGNTEVSIQELQEFQWEKFRSFWDIEPSWQGSVFVLDDRPHDCIVLGAFEGEKLIGYIIYNPLTKRICQIAVDQQYRKQGIGTRLFEAIGEKSSGQPVAFNNVDDSSEEISSFLANRTGLTHWLSQYEMKRIIS
ncbi:GNAT family N-acetyltransferase [Chryseobacterium pennipullorum]|uniref:GNAT family N-acetyltransferase n=1 Tax=Chryseobacterium pennipullorum TaxID=2258963 RepID=A0A3D9APT6_9FLAO|nr:GNAT family N-acetyltransferase [Chryseobacterium pennipullorum]REC43401.1 GNAT family N-acetyltransferase [Chryseobacterium pennipullorum]